MAAKSHWPVSAWKLMWLTGQSQVRARVSGLLLQDSGGGNERGDSHAHSRRFHIKVSRKEQ